MPSLKRLTAIAGTAAAARSYIRKNPDKVNKMAATAGKFIDKRTKGKYHKHIDTAVRKVHSLTGGSTASATTTPATVPGKTVTNTTTPTTTNPVSH
ncbi:antitoxin [Actinophytocola sp.]|uniref:antitoxin n=1 Tax=Actinophytocola sp. TaxID=1872138 RepID=UPI00389B1094